MIVLRLHSPVIYYYRWDKEDDGDYEANCHELSESTGVKNAL